MVQPGVWLLGRVLSSDIGAWGRLPHMHSWWIKGTEELQAGRVTLVVSSGNRTFIHQLRIQDIPPPTSAANRQSAVPHPLCPNTPAHLCQAPAEEGHQRQQASRQAPHVKGCLSIQHIIGKQLVRQQLGAS